MILRSFERVAVYFLVTLGLLAIPLAVIAMMGSGLGWDARTDAGQSIAIREVIPQLPPGTDLQVAYDQIYLTAEFYGILIPQLADILHFFISGSTEMLQMNDMATYKLQGMATILIATLGAAALGVASASALKSRLAGSFTWALIMLMPIYFGMSYVNIKDMPVAAGLSLLSAGLILNRSTESTLMRWVCATLFWVLGASIALATRPGLWPLLLVFSLGNLGLFAIHDLRKGNLRRSLPGVAGLLAAILVSLTLLWWSNPFGRLALFPWLMDSFSVMRAYPWQGTIRTAGQDVLSTDLPWWYVPAWVLAQLPILTTLLASVGFVVMVASVLRRQWSLPTHQVINLAPVVTQALFLPLAIILSGAILYDAVRHLLFLFPALAAVASVTIAFLQYRSTSQRLVLRNMAALTAVLVVTVSTWATLRWMPYSYAFINPIAGWNQPKLDWELDYWGVSAYEGVERLKERSYGYIATLPTEETSSIYGAGSLENTVKASGSNPYGLYVFNRWDFNIGDCTPLFAIKRDGQILGEGAECRNPSASILDHRSLPND